MSRGFPDGVRQGTARYGTSAAGLGVPPLGTPAAEVRRSPIDHCCFCVWCSFQNRTISRLVVGKTGQRHLGSLWIRTSVHRLRSSVVAGAKWCGPRNSGSIGRIRAVPQGGPTGVLASLRTSPCRGTLSPGPPGIYRFAAASAGWEPWWLARNVGPAGRVGTLAPRTACVAALCPAARQRRNSNASFGSPKLATKVPGSLSSG